MTSPNIKIHRDAYGIPSIEAASMADAAYGLGYAMAQDCAIRMAQLYLSAKGRSAEVVGDIALQMDYLVRALGLEEEARAEMSTIPPDLSAILDSFCAGVNRSIDEQRSTLPPWVTPIAPVDVVALVHLSNIAFPLLELTAQLAPGSGSNQFAVAGRHTASGHSLVSIDPHLDWDKAISWYEFSLYYPENAIRGIAVCGIPIPIMGHNSRVAWSMTNNDPKLYGLFALTVDGVDPNYYSFYGDRRRFVDSIAPLNYVDREGVSQTEHMPLRMTEWGPVINAGGIPCALHLPLVDAVVSLKQAVSMMSAGSVGEFQEALRPLGLTMWNFVFADVDGDIAYQYNARVPRRDSSFDWSRPVSGADPRTRWGEPIPLNELPSVVNPASGVLVNANSSPWLTSTSGEIAANAWPGYVTSHPSTFRYERLAGLLSNPAGLTVDDAMAIAVDTMTPAGIEFREAMLSASKSLLLPELSEALSVLQAWDGRADPDSKGTALYHCWLSISGTGELARKLLDGVAWTASDVAEGVGALCEAVDAVKLVHGRVDVPWGEVHVSRRNGREAAVSGFEDAVAPNRGPTVDGKVVCDFGSSFRMIVELDPAGVRSWSAKPYGNALTPSSQHFVDQMEMFGRGEYKDTLFGLDRIRAAAATTVDLER